MTIWQKKRQASGLSKMDMANELGLNYGRYVSIEKGDVKMPSHLIDKFNEIINRGKQNEITNVENNIKADEFWNEVRKQKEDGTYVLIDKMKDFNIPNMHALVNLLGYKSTGTVYNYLQGRNPVGDEFKKRLYAFFNNELNIQIPTKVVGSGKKNPRRTREPIVNKELDKYYMETDFKKILKDNAITNTQIAKELGVHVSTVSNMTSKKAKPSYRIIQNVKDYLEKILTKEETVGEPIVTETVSNFPEISDSYSHVEDLVPTEHVEEPITKTTACIAKETPSVVKRYQNELVEIDNVLEMYKLKIQDLEIRKKICTEVLNAINELMIVEE